MASLTEFLGRDIALKSDMMVAPNGDLQTIEGLANVKEALFHRLITSPGTLVHRPDYGVGLKDYQNAPNSLSVYRRLAERIQEQFQKDPRIASVSGVRIAPDDNNPALVRLTVTVDIVGYGETALQWSPFNEGV